MCGDLTEMIERELIPLVREAMETAAGEGEETREAELGELLATLEEILSDIDAEIMDAWECGELLEEFRRYRASGEILDRIS